MAVELPNKNAEESLSVAERTRSGQMYRPNVDVIEQAEGLTVLADMPGTRCDQIEIQLENGTLTIHGRVQPREVSQAQAMLQEYGVGDFHRTFQVGDQIDAARIEASYADGVLRLHLPKVEAVKPRKISVQAR